MLNCPRPDPFGEIYLNKTLWYRLYESDIIDKDEAVSQNNWVEYNDLIDKSVQPFVESLDNLYHPNTYAFYGHTIDSDGTLAWKKTSLHYPKNIHESDRKLPNNYREIPCLLIALRCTWSPHQKRRGWHGTGGVAECYMP